MKPRDQISKRESKRSTNRVDALVQRGSTPREVRIVSSEGVRTIMVRDRFAHLNVSDQPGRSGRRRRQRRRQRARDRASSFGAGKGRD